MDDKDIRNHAETLMRVMPADWNTKMSLIDLLERFGSYIASKVGEEKKDGIT